MGWFGWDWLRADAYDQTVIAQSLVMAIIFLSFVVVTGMSGQVSLMQASFVTAGGFAAGWALTHDFGVNIPGFFAHGQINFFWAVVIGALAAAALGALLALPLMRLGGVNFALGTLAWAFFLALVPFSTDSIRNGESGWTIRAPTLDVPGSQLAQRPHRPQARMERRRSPTCPRWTSACCRSRSCCSSRCSACSPSSSTR